MFVLRLKTHDDENAKEHQWQQYAQSRGKASAFCALPGIFGTKVLRSVGIPGECCSNPDYVVGAGANMQILSLALEAAFEQGAAKVRSILINLFSGSGGVFGTIFALTARAGVNISQLMLDALPRQFDTI